jgi:hypothetical protein
VERKTDGTFLVEITLGNAAMQTGRDIGEALVVVGAKVTNGDPEGAIMDVNGNRVGSFWYEDGPA